MSRRFKAGSVEWRCSPVREMLARAVEANGGYAYSYHDRWPLSWDLPVWPDKTEFDELFDTALQTLRENFIGDDPTAWTVAHLKGVKHGWNDEMANGELFYQIVERMREDVTDADTYRFMRPEIEKRYGLSADPLLSPFDVEFEFEGRGGKHLVITSFEGRRLEGCTSQDFAEMLRSDGTGNYPNSWCRNLLAMIEEWDLCFTDEQVQQAWLDAASYELAQRLNDIHEQGSTLELRLQDISEPVFIEDEVQVRAQVAGSGYSVPIFRVAISDVGGTQKAALLANIFKGAVEAHLDVHG